MSHKDKLEKWFDEERAYYKGWYEDTHKQIDTILLTVSVAALGWFFSQWKEIGDANNLISYICVVVVFIGFLWTIFSNILGLWFSAETARRYILNLDHDYHKTENTEKIEDINGVEQVTKKRKYGTICH